jgi:hypothetical protein
MMPEDLRERPIGRHSSVPCRALWANRIEQQLKSVDLFLNCVDTDAAFRVG